MFYMYVARLANVNLYLSPWIFSSHRTTNSRLVHYHPIKIIIGQNVSCDHWSHIVSRISLYLSESMFHSSRNMGYAKSNHHGKVFLFFTGDCIHSDLKISSFFFNIHVYTLLSLNNKFWFGSTPLSVNARNPDFFF